MSDLNARAYSAPALAISARSAQATATSVTAPSSSHASGSTGAADQTWRSDELIEEHYYYDPKQLDVERRALATIQAVAAQLYRFVIDMTASPITVCRGDITTRDRS